jgi:hypothetical protein
VAVSSVQPVNATLIPDSMTPAINVLMIFRMSVASRIWIGFSAPSDPT